MMKTMAICVLILGAAVAFSTMSVFSEEQASARADVAGSALVPNAPAAAPAAQTAADAPQPAAGNPFSIEKLAIGLGLCAVIVLAVFRWGASAHSKNRGKDEAASGSPSA